jgi:NAD dependent epimerase/dehydratase family enzyme
MVLGEIADTIVSSQRISIEKLLGTGYNFKFGELESALKNLLIAKD